MKCCKTCNLTKPLNDFYKSSTTKDGFHVYCKVCHKLRNKSKYYENHDANRKRLQAYYYNNHESEKEYRRNHYSKNKDIYLFNSAMRDKRIRQATPCWLNLADLSEIREIYNRCREISETSGVVHHVDHIVPISGKDVCGLHVPWNLQILTSTENLRKSNKHESDVSTSK